MTYAEALAALEARQESRMRLGLGRLRRHLKSLGDPQDRFPCFHVAGTNGKGSVCAILESVLRAQGYRTGFYISPHLRDVRERIRIGGENISRRDFARFLGQVLKADAAEELTYFELLTSAAFLAFAEKKADVVVLETGLGGRLDATNVIKRPLACLITSIELDHTAWLGKTLGRIAAEKAGIIKPGRPVFSPPLPARALRPIAARARRLRSPLTIVSRAWKTRACHWASNSQTLVSGERRCRLGLLGARQGRNVALVEAALRSASERFFVSPRAWRQGLARVRWEGRFEVLRGGGKTAILDGAHNPEAVEHFAKTLRCSPWGGGPLLWVLGVMKDKDYPAILKKIAPMVDQAVVVRPLHPRALEADVLAACLRGLAPQARVSVEPDVRRALRVWLSRPDDPRAAAVTGSFYLVGAARQILLAKWRRP